MKSLLSVCLLFFLSAGCQHSSRINAPDQTVELSEASKEAIEKIVREVVKEEFAALSEDAVSTSLESAIEEVRGKDQARRLEEKKKNADQLILVSLRMASDVQAWERKPTAFGGGGRTGSYMGVQLEKIGYPVDDHGDYTTIHGSFRLEVFEDGSQATITAKNATYGNLILVTIAGSLSSDIKTEIRSL